MRKDVFVCLTIVGGLVGLAAVSNLFFNLAGFFHIQDAASGPMWELFLVVLLFLVVTFASVYFCYRMVRLIRLL